MVSSCNTLFLVQYCFLFATRCYLSNVPAPASRVSQVPVSMYSLSLSVSFFLSLSNSLFLGINSITQCEMPLKILTSVHEWDHEVPILSTGLCLCTLRGKSLLPGSKYKSGPFSNCHPPILAFAWALLHHLAQLLRASRRLNGPWERWQRWCWPESASCWPILFSLSNRLPAFIHLRKATEKVTILFCNMKNGNFQRAKFWLCFHCFVFQDPKPMTMYIHAMCSGWVRTKSCCNRCRCFCRWQW